MSLRPTHAPSAIVGLCRAQKPAQQRQRHWIPPYSAQTVRAVLTLPPDNVDNLLISSTPVTTNSTFDRPNRLKSREESVIKWGELLEKFKSVQEKARRAQGMATRLHEGRNDAPPRAADQDSKQAALAAEPLRRDKALPEVPKQAARPTPDGHVNARPAPAPTGPLGGVAQGHKSKSSLGHLGRLAAGVGGQRKGKR